MHNANKILMGATRSNVKESTNHLSVSGVSIEAGLACVMESTGKLSVDTSEGSLVGVSLGKDLSNTNKTALARKGLGIPLKLKTGFDPVIGAQVAIEDDTGLGRAYTGTGDRYVNATYATGRVGGTGVTGGVAEGADNDVTPTIGVALIDMAGGL